MPFERGSVTFTMFELNGELPDDFLELFSAKKAGTLDSVDAELQFGWVTGHHLLDTTITEESTQLGGCYYLNLRQAVRKMPSSLLNAICKREEQAYMRANQLEYVSSKMRKQIREEAFEKHIKQMPPVLSGIPVVVDPNEKLLFVGASSRTQIELFIDHFFQTAKLEPLQLTPGLLLEKLFKVTSANFPVLNIANLPGDNSEPSIGRDFLMWLWFYSETTGKLEHPQYGQFDILIEAPLTFADEGEAKGAGEIALKKGDSPLRSAEAKAAIAVGKKLKKAKLSVTRDKQIWSGTFDADTFAFGSFKLPEGEELNADEVFAERVQNLIVFREAISLYFTKFAETVMGMEFPKFESEIREWAKNRDAV
ncbi:MAG: recombination-associated protein RdgC [Victivallales bacterium]|jgi:hypothetical protein|nr:recombination-associated protein RdgC [Victivallales bacterium]